MQRRFFYVRGKPPPRQGGSLPYFIAYCRKIEDFKPEISLFFPIAKTVGGGGGIIKNVKTTKNVKKKGNHKVDFLKLSVVPAATIFLTELMR